MIYKPVCADGQTFTNACVAEAHGYKTHRPGKCEDTAVVPARKCPEGYSPYTFPGGVRRCARPMSGDCRPTETQLNSKDCKGTPGSRTCPAFCTVEEMGASGDPTLKCPEGKVWEKCATGAIGTRLCPAGGLCIPKCKGNERLFLSGTPFARCQSKSARRCAQNEIEVCPVCLPGRSCDCTCVARPEPGRQAPDPCPPGTVWESTCQRGSICIVGGRCVPQGGGNKCPGGMEWNEARHPKTGHVRHGCILTSEAKGRDPCAQGKRLSPVVCVRAPCPALCLPDLEILPKPEKL
jgi:hypothetical protein